MTDSSVQISAFISLVNILNAKHFCQKKTNIFKGIHLFILFILIYLFILDRICVCHCFMTSLRFVKLLVLDCFKNLLYCTTPTLTCGHDRMVVHTVFCRTYG